MYSLYCDLCHDSPSFTTQSTIQSTVQSTVQSAESAPSTPATAPPPSKKRKVNTNGSRTPRAATNRVWRQTRQTAKLRMAMELLDNFRAEHGGKLPSLRAIMKMLKVGFPKAHEILDQYAKHVGCSKEQLVQDMTIRQEKRHREEEEEGKKKRLHRNMLEYPINVNGKLQEMILNLLHQQRVHNTSGSMAVLTKLERSMGEFENFYAKFGLNDKLRMGQSYFILAQYHYDQIEQCRHRASNDTEEVSKGLLVGPSGVPLEVPSEVPSEEEQSEIEAAYQYIERALSTFRDCNRLMAKLGLNVAEFDPDRTVSVHHDVSVNETQLARYQCDPQDVGYFWEKIYQIYILGMFTTL